jgi:hypothetical protein
MTELKPCKYCGGAKRFQIVSPVSDHAWANCFCTRAAPRTDGDVGELVERLLDGCKYVHAMDLPRDEYKRQIAMAEAAARITALSAEVEHWKRLHAENCAAYDKVVAEREHFRSALGAKP